MDATVRWQGFAEEAYLSPADLLVYALLLIFGALHVYFAARAPDFPGDNVFWIDSGRSLVEHGFYGINGYSETNMPPGLPALLGVMGTVWGYQPVIFFRAMAVFGTLALLVSYELLKRSLSRSIAAAICLLLITSVTHFKLVTQEVWP